MLLLTTSLLLSGCGITTSSQEVATCPALKGYTRQQMDRAAHELDALSDDSELVGMIGDYGDLRAQVRACNKAK